MRDDQLRQRVRMLKATKAIDNYYEVAELLEVSEKAFYNWLSGCYDLGHTKQQHLKAIVDDLCIPV